MKTLATRRGRPRRSRVRSVGHAFAVLAVLAALALACSGHESEEGARAGGNSEPVPAPNAAPASAPTRLGPDARIVSLSPLATRFLTQLGAADRIVPLDEATGSQRDASASPLDPAVPPSEAELDRLIALDPDVVFLPALPDDRGVLARLEATGARVVEFAPHGIEDVLAYGREIGTELVGEEAVVAFQRRVLAPVGLIAGQAPPYGRLRAIALVDVDPPTIAGGHSNETDLIELAGATSLTHGGDDNRRPIDRAALEQLAPDVVLVMTEGELGPADQDRALLFVGDLAPVVFFAGVREALWLDEPVREVERLRAEILALEAQRDAKAESTPKGGKRGRNAPG